MSGSSKSRNFRRRGDANDDADGNTNVNPNPSTAPPRKLSSSSISSSKPKKKLLSFEDDEDGDYVTPPPSSRVQSSKSSSSTSTTTTSRLAKAKTSSSHKLTTAKDRLPPTPSSTASNVQPQAGIYTKEALLELQKNTRTLAKPSEPKIVLKGLLKPPDVDDNPFLLEDDRINVEEGERSEAQNRLASLGLGKSKSDDYSLIPDEDTIKKIRAKRERMRQSRGAAPDYISLDTGINHHGSDAEGLSDEEPEFRTRVAMIGHVKKKESGGSTPGVFEDMVVDDDDVNAKAANVKEGAFDDQEEDEEDKIWEEEQFRKGLGKRMDDASGTNRVLSSAATTTTTPSNMMMHNQQQQQQRSMTYGAVPNIGGSFGADALSIPQQAEIARRALLENVKRLKESHGRTISSLTKADENLSSSLMNITSLEKSLTAAGEKFIFMQKLRDFVSVICEFLQHKAPFIEELEEQMQKLNEQRALAILERRTADTDDEMMEVEVAVKAAMLVLDAHGSIDAAKRAAQDASSAMKEQQINLPVKLDELGRDLNQQKRMDMKRRAEARKKRKARFDSKRLSSMELDGSDQKVEGESSTDESDSESAAYQSNRDLLLQTADQIFSDASEEYSQLSVVKKRFEGWKKEYSASYRDAYMSLSVPAIFSPYVRLELLKWDPLHEDADFFDMKWHSLLFNYGLPEDGGDVNLDDADGNLVPELIERVAIPILHHEIAHCWDMLSLRETKNAVSATSLVINYVPASSEALADLLLAIHTRLADAVANIKVPTWKPHVLQAVPNAARVSAYRFGVSVRLMRNIGLWKDILALSILEKLALEELLFGKVLPHVRSIVSNIHDAITRTERIIDSLSGVWSGPSVTGNHSRKLQPLVDYVILLGRTLEKKRMAEVSGTEIGALARRLKKMLVDLNDYDSARCIVKTFDLKEAL
ncbi:hypothetical protein K2173_006843 [Erythroxylum novogranatense]|uniref:GCF C-terminal domain-containing protein n=1 Tax=Erythroxylum novogranatense TaxID=1862640 RepID=A0AAV8SZ98_9ROSI|nr:hypothetical protein K2173_006843 [Erythroxylum novogranatense]